MNVLLIGSGGREHALAWSLAKSPRLSKLYATSGNPGIESLAETVELDISDHETTAAFCRNHKIELVVVGPEAPLVDGLADSLSKVGIKVFGPSASAARLEGSKGFTKDMCARAGIPTAAYGRFDNADAAKDCVRNSKIPIVVKADGLAAGKGVVVANGLSEALDAVDNCFSGAFGAAGAEVIVEECLIGEEASFFALSDGGNILPLMTAQDHKRVGEGDTGPNTGGMGAYCPAPVMTNEMVNHTVTEIITPTVNEMKANGCPFKGVLYAGLMITDEGPKLIEYNVRFGDPECQVLMMMLKSDLLELLLATVDGNLDKVDVQWHEGSAMTVVMAAEGYPGTYSKGTEIRGIDAAGADPDVEIFHAGTKRVDGGIVAIGGRVLNVSARGSNLSRAHAKAYEAVGKIDWSEGFCRKDIGWRAL